MLIIAVRGLCLKSPYLLRIIMDGLCNAIFVRYTIKMTHFVWVCFVWYEHASSRWNIWSNFSLFNGIFHCEHLSHCPQAIFLVFFKQENLQSTINSPVIYSCHLSQKDLFGLPLYNVDPYLFNFIFLATDKNRSPWTNFYFVLFSICRYVQNSEHKIHVQEIGLVVKL